MSNHLSTALLKATATSALLLTLTACDNTGPNEFSIRITNLTHGQPVSPPIAMLHSKHLSFWEIGEAASEALEKMAEGGDGSALLLLKKNNPQFQADAPLLPGASLEFTIKSDRYFRKNLSVAGMLVNTNDGFSGLNGVELSELESGQTTVFYSNAYDAGTELNSELTGTIPGPADGSEGFNAARDDVTPVVTLHGGIVSADDNFPNSTLNYADKFDNPVLRIVVTAM
ncbi:MAG: spondin domain-containing protein [Gammaproteobacteria bacterium]|nr:spondin domain-containing protein [Gammaproteobacteria bacterium]